MMLMEAPPCPAGWVCCSSSIARAGRVSCWAISRPHVWSLFVVEQIADPIDQPDPIDLRVVQPTQGPHPGQHARAVRDQERVRAARRDECAERAGLGL